MEYLPTQMLASMLPPLRLSVGRWTRSSLDKVQSVVGGGVSGAEIIPLGGTE